MSTDIQTTIETAASANAVSLGNGAATEMFREGLKSAYTVTANLTQADANYLKKHVTFPLLFRKNLTPTHDHSVLAAMRQLARDVYERCFEIRNTTEKTLVVGATAREMTMYDANPNIHHYVYAGENKDYDRIVRPVLNKIANNLKKRASKKDRRVYLPHPESDEATKGRSAAKRYTHIQQMLKDLVETGRKPSTYHMDPVDCNTLLFEDSIYNFSGADLINLFERTRANIGYGYGFFPMELLFSDLPRNQMYNFSSDGTSGTVTFRRGFSNGYKHRLATWRTILNGPVITHKGRHIVVEIVSRVGPMIVFKLMYAEKPESVVRTIGLTDPEAYVKLLDLESMFDFDSGKLILPLKYVSVRESEYFDALNYMCALDSKSMNVVNCISYVRRRMGGLSLVTKELLSAWDLPTSQVAKCCMTVTAQARLLTGRMEQFSDPNNLSVSGWWDSLVASWKSWGKRMLMDKAGMLAAVLIRFSLQERLVLYPPIELYQEGYDRKSLRPVHPNHQAGDTGPHTRTPEEEHDLYERGRMGADLHLDYVNEEDVPDCSVCLELFGRLGQQQMHCETRQHSVHRFSLNDSQLAKMKADLMDSDSDPVGIKEVKKRALTELSRMPFERDVKVHYIKAGPGCGKSYVIRQMADENDMVLAPFSKLKPDYEKLKSPTGEMYDLIFKTQHRAMEMRNMRRIFVDEFTSFPYEFLACIAYLNQTEEIYLVGDDKQSRIIEPDIGLYIGNYIPLSNMCTHTLLVNFRNPPDTVALLNKLYGYQMRTSKAKVEIPSIRIVTPAEDEQNTALRMCFSKAGSKQITEVESNTVRSNQGGTAKDVKLYLTSLDKTTPQEPTLQTVALSRHTDSLTIISDGSPEALKFLSIVDQGPSWMSDYDTHLKFDTKPAIPVLESDPMIARVLVEPDSDIATCSESDAENSCLKLTSAIAKQIKQRFVRANDTDSDEDDRWRNPKSKPKPVKEVVRKSTSDEDCGYETTIASLGGWGDMIKRTLLDTEAKPDQYGFYDKTTEFADIGIKQLGVRSWDGAPVHTMMRLAGPCQSTLNLQVVKVPGDGMCCFSALALAIAPKGVAGGKDLQRELGLDPLRHAFSPDIIDELDPNSPVYGGMATIGMTAQKYDVNVCVHFAGCPERTSMALARTSTRVVHLLLSGAHYDALMADKDDRLPLPSTTLHPHLAVDALQRVDVQSEGVVPTDSGLELDLVDTPVTDPEDVIGPTSGRLEEKLSSAGEKEVKNAKRRPETFRDRVAGVCECVRLRNYKNLVDNDRLLVPSTADKIDQLLPLVAGDGVLSILGGAPGPNAKLPPMVTPTVVDMFAGWWTVDPRFARVEDPRVIVDSFENVSFEGTHNYVSDMYMTSDSVDGFGRKWVNNGIRQVFEKYMEDNDKNDWQKFRLVHKLTWSTTNTADLAEVLMTAEYYDFRRIRASGKSSEWFLHVRGIAKISNPTSCCALAGFLDTMWKHVSVCGGCHFGRGLGMEAPSVYRSVHLDRVWVNCVPAVDTMRMLVGQFRTTGKIKGMIAPSVPVNQRTRANFENLLRRKPLVTYDLRGGGSWSTTPVLELLEDMLYSGTKESYTPGDANTDRGGTGLPLEDRNTVKDYTVGVVEDEGRQYISENPDFKDQMETWVMDPRMGTRDYYRLPMLPPLDIKPQKPVYDAFRGLPELLSFSAVADDVASWNEQASQVVKGKFGAGKIIVDQVVCPVNSRKHPVKSLEVYRSAGPGLGLHYSARKPCQTLAALETRYLNIREIYPFGWKEKQMANEIVDLWWREHVRPGYAAPMTFTDEEIDAAYRVLLQDARSKGYAERYTGTGGMDSHQGRQVRFHLKGIFKPKIALDPYKVGQGISAWSVQTLAMYCNVFRILTGTTVRLEKDHVVTDSYWTEREFIDYLNGQFERVPEVAPFGVTDGEMFDACQNLFTQELEKGYLRRLGVSEAVIDHYYSFRAGYLLVSTAASGRAGTQKTSGEPGTLYNNGSVSKMISNWLLRGDGPEVIVYKGDDFVKRQCSLKIMPDRKLRLDGACGLKIRVHISKGPISVV